MYDFGTTSHEVFGLRITAKLFSYGGKLRVSYYWRGRHLTGVLGSLAHWAVCR